MVGIQVIFIDIVEINYVKIIVVNHPIIAEIEINSEIDTVDDLNREKVENVNNLEIKKHFKIIVLKVDKVVDFSDVSK